MTDDQYDVAMGKLERMRKRFYRGEDETFGAAIRCLLYHPKLDALAIGYCYKGMCMRVRFNEELWSVYGYRFSEWMKQGWEYIERFE